MDIQLNQLRVFEACGRLSSFTRAAEELHITPSAVSHQIKALEEKLKSKLFQRTNRHVILTQAGEEYWLIVHDSIGRMQTEAQRIFALHSRPLRILCARSFLRHWLMPRLTDFYSRHPGVKIEFSTFDRAEDVTPVSHDVAIRLGDGRWRGYRADRLNSINLFPIASPGYIAGHAPIKKPADLLDHVLIRTVGRTADDWALWFSACGLVDVQPQDTIAIEGETLEYQAALTGLGVALGRETFCEREIAEGRLVRLFDFSVQAEGAYYLLCQPGILQDGRVASFRKWILAVSRTAGPDGNQNPGGADI